MHLYALILHLHPTAPTTLPAMLGEQAHAAFLATVRHADPALSAHLHEDTGQTKPFGVALLAPWSALRARTWRVGPQDTLRLRVTLAGQALYEQFMSSFLRGQYALRLGHADFTTGRIIASGEGEALSGFATTAQLWDEATPRDTQRLRFVMPTTWRQGKEPYRSFALLPEPRPIFQKLSQTWHQWAEPSYHFDFRALLAALDADAVLPTAHHLRTVHWQAAKPPTQGFIGWTRYQVSSSPEFQRQIDLLSSLAAFAGVGNGSGRGLGVVVRDALPERGSGAESDDDGDD